jgi:hypothetical protein
MHNGREMGKCSEMLEKGRILLRITWFSISKTTKTTVYVSFVIFLVGFGSFELGRLSVSKALKTPITIEEGGVAWNDREAPAGRSASGITQAEATSSPEGFEKTGMYVGSKSSRIFHLPTCPGAKRLKDENKIWFTTKEEALKNGYTAAANCKGI